METPILINPSEIEKVKWKERFYAAITCFFIFLFGIATGIIISDSRIMNRVEVETVREVTKIEQHWPTNYFDSEGRWLLKGDPVKLTPEKEKDGMHTNNAR